MSTISPAFAPFFVNPSRYTAGGINFSFASGRAFGIGATTGACPRAGARAAETNAADRSERRAGAEP